MTPQQLYQALLDRHGLKDGSLAKAIGKPNLQSTLYRFRNNRTSDPRSAWIEPVARYFNISPDAFRSTERATDTARELGLIGSESHGTNESAPTPYRSTRRTQNRIDPGILVLQLADVMRPLDPATRDAAGSLLASVARDPDQAPVIAARIRGLLAPLPTARQRAA